MESGDPIVLEVEDIATIGDVKGMIRDSNGILPRDQHLTYSNGEPLEDNWETLADADVSSDSPELNLSVRKITTPSGPVVITISKKDEARRRYDINVVSTILINHIAAGIKKDYNIGDDTASFGMVAKWGTKKEEKKTTFEDLLKPSWITAGDMSWEGEDGKMHIYFIFDDIQLKSPGSSGATGASTGGPKIESRGDEDEEEEGGFWKSEDPDFSKDGGKRVVDSKLTAARRNTIYKNNPEFLQSPVVRALCKWKTEPKPGTVDGKDIPGAVAWEDWKLYRPVWHKSMTDVDIGQMLFGKNRNNIRQAVFISRGEGGFNVLQSNLAIRNYPKKKQKDELNAIAATMPSVTDFSKLGNLSEIEVSDTIKMMVKARHLKDPPDRDGKVLMLFKIPQERKYIYISPKGFGGDKNENTKRMYEHAVYLSNMFNQRRKLDMDFKKAILTKDYGKTKKWIEEDDERRKGTKIRETVETADEFLKELKDLPLPASDSTKSSSPAAPTTDDARAARAAFPTYDGMRALPSPSRTQLEKMSNLELQGLIDKLDPASGALSDAVRDWKRALLVSDVPGTQDKTIENRRELIDLILNSY
jgi:hypothetical protein